MKVHILGKMGDVTRVIITWVKKKDLGFINIRMGKFMKENGNVANSMERVK